MNRMTHAAVALTTLAALGLCVSTVHAQGYTLTTLVNFNGTNGGSAVGGLMRVGNTLYGTTETGGDLSLNSGYGDGTVFSLNASSGVLTTLATFDDIKRQFPFAGLILSPDQTTLYGTTNRGGPGGLGTVFSIPRAGGALTTVANLDGADGFGPSADLTLSADGTTLYGTARYGGPSNSGTVFSVPITGGTPTALATFNGPNGEFPYAGVTLSADGKTLYGTTAFASGLPTSGAGTVFSVPVTGGSLTTLAAFNGTDGATPFAGLTLSADGKTLYGTTETGGDLSVNSGQGYGTVFSLDIGTGTLTTLVAFNGTNGAVPAAGLNLVGSTLYGTTETGGDLSVGSGYGDGTIFSLETGTRALTTLATFNGTDGARPVAGLTFSADGTTLYGTTSQGGTSNNGTVFSLMPTPEPSQFAALAIGILGLCALGLRTRKRSRRRKHND